MRALIILVNANKRLLKRLEDSFGNPLVACKRGRDAPSC
jgi:hypothetical protein